jgi:ABC-type transport system substrate-binding protein
VIVQLIPGRNVEPVLEIPIGSSRSPLMKYGYDRERSKRLLAEAGYPDGLDVYLYVDNEKMMDFGKLVAGYLERAGIHSKLMVIPRDAARARASASHDRDASTPVLFIDLERG